MSKSSQEGTKANDDENRNGKQYEIFRILLLFTFYFLYCIVSIN